MIPILFVGGAAAFLAALIIIIALRENRRLDDMLNASGHEFNDITKRLTLIERKLGMRPGLDDCNTKERGK